jgi:hypothetical protein
LQPFLVTFDRHEEHVIVFLLDHPEYEAIEAMVDRRAGGPPRIRATLNLRDGIQIDHFNDPDLARDRAAIFTGRQTVLSPITFESCEVGGAPAVRIHFTSYRGEDIDLDFQARSRPTPELGGFINPGDELTIRKTTTSSALPEEILEAEVVEEAVELRSVRAPRGATSGVLAEPGAAGFVLDLSAPGGFSLSLDEHARLVTGEASRESTDATTRWILEPKDPSWTTSRRVSAAVTRQQAGYVIETEVGEARPGAPE